MWAVPGAKGSLSLQQTAQSDGAIGLERRGWSGQPGEGSRGSINARKRMVSVHRLVEMGDAGASLVSWGQQRAGCTLREWDNAEL